MRTKIVLSFLLVSVFLLLAVAQHRGAFAQESGSQIALEDQCSKSAVTDLDASLCKAVLELQAKVSDLEAKASEKQAPEEQAASDEEVKENETPQTQEDTQDALATQETTGYPIRQMMTGVAPHEIQCKEGQTLVFKASNWRPACINESSLDVLVARGWIANSDPTNEDLTRMQDEYVSEHPQEVMEEAELAVEQVEDTVELNQTDPGVELEEELSMGEVQPSEEEPAETEEIQEQGHSINLKESMEMGAQ